MACTPTVTPTPSAARRCRSTSRAIRSTSTIARNGYDYLQRHQCYATGGYGPNERYMAIDGALGKALETRSDTFETSCGAWAGFKLSSYLLQFTGEARYGDWIERLLYNAIGAALPIRRPRAEFLLQRLPRRRRDEGLQLGHVHVLLGDLHPEPRRVSQPHLLPRSEGGLRQSLRAVGSHMARSRRRRHDSAGDGVSRHRHVEADDRDENTGVFCACVSACLRGRAT